MDDHQLTLQGTRHMGLFSGLRDALGIGGGGRNKNKGGDRPDFNTGGQAQRQPTAAQRPRPNPTRAANNTRGSDGETNVSRWEKYSKQNFSVSDIDTGKAIRVAAKAPTGPVRKSGEGEGGGSMPAPPNPDTSKAPARMVRGIQQKRGGEALGSARFTRKGLGGINRANNRKLGGI